jgi:hypothetical protein
MTSDEGYFQVYGDTRAVDVVLLDEDSDAATWVEQEQRPWFKFYRDEYWRLAKARVGSLVEVKRRER